MEVWQIASSQKETVEFLKPIVTNEFDKKGKVEIWLGDLEEMMKKTLAQLALNASNDDGLERTEWVLKWQAQIVLAINNIRWTYG